MHALTKIKTNVVPKHRNVLQQLGYLVKLTNLQIVLIADVIVHPTLITQTQQYWKQNYIYILIYKMCLDYGAQNDVSHLHDNSGKCVPNNNSFNITISNP